MITIKGNQSEAARPPDYSSSELGGIKSIPPDENERRDDDDYIFRIFRILYVYRGSHKFVFTDL